MRYSAIQICAEELDSSDIPRTEYDWELSVYRGAKEELLEDAPESLGKHHGLLDNNRWKRFHSLTKRAKKMLRKVNQSKVGQCKTRKKHMCGFEISLLGHEDAISLDKLRYRDNSWGGVQEDPSASSCVCVQSPYSILFGSMGSDNISVRG
jgi:hypothetical protein